MNDDVTTGSPVSPGPSSEQCLCVRFISGLRVILKNQSQDIFTLCSSLTSL